MTSIHFDPEAHDSLLTAVNGLSGYTVKLLPRLNAQERVISSAGDDGLWTWPAGNDGAPLSGAAPTLTPWERVHRIVVC